MLDSLYVSFCLDDILRCFNAETSLWLKYFAYIIVAMWETNGKNVVCNFTALKMDEACLHITSDIPNELKLWKQVDECHGCKYLPWVTMPPSSNISLVVETKYPLNFVYSGTEEKFDCGITYHFEEYGVYGWNITKEGCNPVTVIEEPPFPFLPIIGAFIIFLSLSLIWNLGKCAMNSEWMARLRERNHPFSELESDLGSPSSAEGPPMTRADVMPAVRRQRARVATLDVFRGICIALMIFVNYGGGQYWFFKHSTWNGLTVADLVYPWFLWIMGVSLVISLRSQLRSSLRRRQVLARVVKRSIILFGLGLLLNTLSACKRTDLRMLRLPGVLQRIGLAYLIVGTLEALTLKPQGFQYGRWFTLQLQDVLDAWAQWFVVLALAGIHVVLSLLLPVPGCPTGYLGPGGLDSSVPKGDIYQNCTGGAAGYVDRLLLGPDHIYQTPTFRHIYQTVLPFDPEGLLGTLTAVLNVYLGVQAGRILLSYHYSVSRVIRWCVWGIFCGIVAAVLCRFQKDDGWIPVNKNLWSVSFVLLTACFAFLLLSVLYLVVDAGKWWNGHPFLYAGMNPLILYVGHELAKNKFPWSWEPYYHTHTEFLAMDVWGTCLWLLIAFILFKKDIFLSI
ncbi:hypothetical protein R5R35_003200 [Gryllus longicercus]|uniref:Heparan-alpha-glucosaminide N-acetyltransferase catalytic domain-containing protein n=2 Tax=Gryllus longicercus TaxID=2509291 RepID=A0AAN9Z6K1_9ORTH